MSKESPLQTVKRVYGSKDKLVVAVADFARDDNEEKAEAAQRLANMSNKKLLRMAAMAEKVKGLGGRDGLVDAVASAENRAKDADYISKLKTLSPAMLLDRLDAAERRARRKAS